MPISISASARVRFCPIASGSSGNSTYIGTGYTNILIDAGLTGKAAETGLNSIGLTGDRLDGIFITHEHSDHIKGAGIISRRFDVPIFATEGTWQAMQNSLGKIAGHNRKYIYTDEHLILNDLQIRPFSIPHDAAQPVGYSVRAGGYKLSVATDIGHITAEISKNLEESSVLLLEANHDIEKLKNGPYPWILKKRILSDYGHLANISAGQFIAEIATERLQHVFLGHLSDENNTPELAFDTVAEVLRSFGLHHGRNFGLHVAERYSASECIELF